MLFQLQTMFFVVFSYPDLGDDEDDGNGASETADDRPAQEVDLRDYSTDQ